MKHFNGNLPCVVAGTYSGFYPGKGELLEFACMPLDSRLNPHPNIGLFYTMIKPEISVDWEALDLRKKAEYTWLVEKVKITKKLYSDCMLHGKDRFDSADMFERWFDGLNLGIVQQIYPVAHNWAFESVFLKEWLSEPGFSRVFHPFYRDTVCCGLYCNDQIGYRENAISSYPYPKVDLTYLANQCPSIERSVLRVPKCLLDRVRETGRIYKSMVENGQRLL